MGDVGEVHINVLLLKLHIKVLVHHGRAEPCLHGRVAAHIVNVNSEVEVVCAQAHGRGVPKIVEVDP